MRKHNEGYALVLVLVVMIVLSILASGLMTVGLSNMKTQMAMFHRMTDKYQAQGEVEEVLGLLTLEDSFEKKESSDPETQISEWITGDIIDVWAAETKSEGISVRGELMELSIDADTVADGDPLKGEYSGILCLRAEKGTAVIECELAISGTYEEIPPEAPATISTYTLKPGETKYRNYIISDSVEGGGN